MGHGYFLKATHRYSSGWEINKQKLWDARTKEGFYISLAKRCIFKDQPQKEVSTVTEITITENEEKNGVEIRFPSKPEQSILDTLKGEGFRWSRFSSCWYKKRTPEVLSFAHSLKG